MMDYMIFLLLTMTSTISCTDDLRVIDLTHAHGPDTLIWPGDPGYNFTILSRGQQPGHWYESNYVGMAEHCGTHVDAPAHFAKGQWRGQHIPIEKLMGPGVIINVKHQVKTDPDYRVTVEDLELWEKIFGRIPKGAVVMMNSGWDSNYPNKILTFGSDRPTDSATFHFPGFHEDAAEWLVTNRDVNILGVDTPSTDYGQSATFPVHIVLGKADVIGAENVANLDRIPQSGTMIYVAAFKIFDGSGGPARIFATYTDGSTTSSAHGCQSSILSMSITVLCAVIYIYM